MCSCIPCGSWCSCWVGYREVISRYRPTSCLSQCMCRCGDTSYCHEVSCCTSYSEGCDRCSSSGSKIYSMRRSIYFEIIKRIWPNKIEWSCPCSCTPNIVECFSTTTESLCLRGCINYLYSGCSLGECETCDSCHIPNSTSSWKCECTRTHCNGTSIYVRRRKRRKGMVQIIKIYRSACKLECAIRCNSILERKSITNQIGIKSSQKSPSSWCKCFWCTICFKI